MSRQSSILQLRRRGQAGNPACHVKSERYLATWMDKNKNQVIDADELERMVLEFKSASKGLASLATYQGLLLYS